MLSFEETKKLMFKFDPKLPLSGSIFVVKLPDISTETVGVTSIKRLLTATVSACALFTIKSIQISKNLKNLT